MTNFILSGFSDEISSDFSEQLAKINELNIAYIEIRGVNGQNITSYSLDEVDEIKKQLDASGIKVSAIGSPIGKIHIKENFEDHFELFKHTVAIARRLKTTYIRLFSFFMEQENCQIYRNEVIRRVKAFVDYVEGSEIILLHENEKEIYGDTPERCLDLYKTMGSENFRLIFDPANFIQCDIETYPHAFEMLQEAVIYYHIKDACKVDHKVVPSGYGDGHVLEIMKALYRHNYNGFLSLEPHLGHFEGFEALEHEGDLPEFEEQSDAGKFELAYRSLMTILEEVKNG